MNSERQQMQRMSQDKYNIQEQWFQGWKTDIQRIETQLVNKYRSQNLKTNLQKAFQLYSSALISPKDLKLIETFLQLKYPNIPVQQIINKLYHYNQQQLQLTKHTDLIAESLRKLLCGKDPANLIDCVHQYLSTQGHLPHSIIEYPKTKIQIPSAPRPQRIPSGSVDFYDQLNDQNPQFFQGAIINKGTQQLKQKHQTFTGQKKVVHVYTKKGQGVKIYRKHLQIRKMDTKEWDYYQKEFVQNNNYDFYLLSAIHATLNIVVEFVRNLKEGKYYKDPFSHCMDQQEFGQIINSIFQMDGQLKKSLNDCLRVVFELKIEKILHKNHVILLFNHLSNIRDLNQQLIKKRTEINLMNDDIDQIFPFIQFDEFDF